MLYGQCKVVQGSGGDLGLGRCVCALVHAYLQGTYITDARVLARADRCDPVYIEDCVALLGVQ